MTQPVLCYCESSWAYFTTRALHEQWGDDWNDAPYEHNAGRPNTWKVISDGRWCRCKDPQGVFCYNGGAVCGKDGHVPKPPISPWTITRVGYDARLDTPADIAGRNSSWSVEQINRGFTPWLQTSRWEPSTTPLISIFAGVTIEEFTRLVKSVGGRVWIEDKE